MKRAFDVIAALVCLVVVSPVLLLIAIGVWMTLGRPLLFRQTRAGLHGRGFTLVKFRTMREPFSGADESDGDRLTSFGRALRSTSLDELPELWNVVKGDMSLVGPRPLLMEYLPRYSATQARRHDVRPGMTGWAQVNGRNALTWPDRLDLDVWYVDHRSFALDLTILARTLVTVVRRTGISEDGHPTSRPFLGSSSESQARD